MWSKNWKRSGAFQNLGAEQLKDLSPIVVQEADGIDKIEAKDKQIKYEENWTNMEEQGYRGLRKWESVEVVAHLNWKACRTV